MLREGNIVAKPHANYGNSYTYPGNCIHANQARMVREISASCGKTNPYLLIPKQVVGSRTAVAIEAHRSETLLNKTNP